MEHIDAILYINLSHRKDRNTHILNQITTNLCTDNYKIHRIDAIYKPNIGILGCTLSHIKALEYFREHPEWNNCLIFEDDFTFKSNNIIENNDNIRQIFTDFSDYDCFLLSTNPIFAKYQNTHIENIKKTLYSQTASGYIISKQFINSLIENLKEAANFLENIGRQSWNSNDIYWSRLQPISKWYMFIPSLGYQVDSYSDVENKDVSYKC